MEGQQETTPISFKRSHGNDIIRKKEYDVNHHHLHTAETLDLKKNYHYFE